MSALALVKDLNDKLQEYNDIKKKAVAELQPKFKDIFVPFLDKYPQVKMITWTQYTPYFNDGEECIFSVGDLHFCVGDVHDPEDSHYEWQDGAISSWVLDPKTDSSPSPWQFERHAAYIKVFGDQAALNEYNTAATDLIKEFRSVPDDVMEDLFGNHVQITVTREGLDVEEYEHD